MASGKTTFGRALAKATGREFIDLDFRIEQRRRATISEIFDEIGESGFRKVETYMLREVGEMENVVIACGGGTPCFNDNMEYMLGAGDVLWLQATPERIVERLKINRSRRPLMAAKSEAELLEAVNAGLSPRIQYYSQAGIHFDGNRLENRRQISESIAAFLAEHPDI